MTKNGKTVYLRHYKSHIRNVSPMASNLMAVMIASAVLATIVMPWWINDVTDGFRLWATRFITTAIIGFVLIGHFWERIYTVYLEYHIRRLYRQGWIFVTKDQLATVDKTTHVYCYDIVMPDRCVYAVRFHDDHDRVMFRLTI